MIDEFAPDKIGRAKLTGTFGKIVKRCICGNDKMPIQYEVLVESKVEGQFHVMVFYQDELELECPPVSIL